MRKSGLIWLVLIGMLQPGYSQSAQPRSSGPQVGNTPTPNDMYCSGFITTQHVPEKLFVAAGHNSPDQSRYAGTPDRPARERHQSL
jgi:hypothetical protein